MRLCVFVIASLALTIPLADAQMIDNRSPVAGLPAESYAIPPPVPAGGCVWDNAVFSNGAIFERYLGRPFYFRCTDGQWQSFYTFYEAMIGRDDPPILKRNGQQRPTPLR